MVECSAGGICDRVKGECVFASVFEGGGCESCRTSLHIGKLKLMPYSEMPGGRLSMQ